MIVPCRNEEGYIRACLESILRNTYSPEQMEILVVDGMSDDKTLETIARMQEEWPGRIRLIQNEKRILAAAWNLGIVQGQGDIIMGLNAHGVFDARYIETCVRALETTGVDYCGGVIRTHPRSNGLVARSIARVLSSPFGVGGSRFRTGVSRPVEADTAAFGGYRRRVFERVGLFDERLTRSQDFDFHLRMKEAGCRILLHPDMACDYYVRTELGRFVKDYVRNGFWLTYPLRYNRRFFSWRHFVPCLCVIALVVILLLSMIVPPLLWLVAAFVALYVAANVFFSLKEARKAQETAFLLTLPPLYALLHATYGLGSVFGLAKAIADRRYERH